MAHAHRIEHLNDGQVVYIALDPNGLWARSEFPHPLVIVDYDTEGNVIGISPAGPLIDATLDAYRSWRTSGARDAHALVNRLSELPELEAA
jgi:hypothetical protein